MQAVVPTLLALLVLAARLAVAPTHPTTPPAATSPTTSVWVTLPGGDSTPLRGWLVVQLLAQGYTLAGDPARADVDLTVVTLGEDGGWEVIAEGRSSQRFVVKPAAQPAVAKLELLHRAVDAVDAIEPRRVGDSPTARSFAIKLSETLAPSMRSASEQQIATAVLSAGGTVTPDASTADFVLCAASGAIASEVEVTLVAAGEGCPRPPAPSTETTPAGLRTRALVTAALAPAPAQSETAPDARPTHDEETAPALAPSVAAAPTRGRVWPSSAGVVRAGAASGVVVRGAADAMLATSLHIGREPGVSAWLDLQVWPFARSDQLTIVEYTPAAGVRLRPLTRGRVSIHAGALVGAQFHAYRSENRAAGLSDRGVLVDVSAEGAIGVALALWRGLEIEALLRGGTAGRSRIHVARGVALWSRSAWRVAATLGISFGWKVRA